MDISERGAVTHLTRLSTLRGRAPHSASSDGLKNRLGLKTRVLDVYVRHELDPPDIRSALPSFGKSTVLALVHDTRTLVYQVAHDIKPLWQVGSVEEFQKCYVDLLEAHFHAYDPDRVLHRDISATSALARLRPDGKVAGLLNDWDLTCAVEGEGLGQQLAPQLRSGSTIFMAIDLQRRAGGKYAVTNHRYCHDLESFFWLLVWAVLHFELNNKRHLDCNMSADWTGGWAESSFFKVDLLDSGYTMDGVLQNTLDIWQDVVECWVRPLACLLDTARQSSTRWVDKRRKVFDVNAYANELTFEAFVQTIEQLPRTRALEEA